MINIFLFCLLLIFIFTFIAERYYFYKIFCSNVNENTTRVLSGLTSNEYKPINLENRLNIPERNDTIGCDNNL